MEISILDWKFSTLLASLGLLYLTDLLADVLCCSTQNISIKIFQYQTRQECPIAAENYFQ